MWIRQRLPEKRRHDAKDRDHGAKPDRERCRATGRIDRIAAQSSHGELQIAPEIFEQRKTEPAFAAAHTFRRTTGIDEHHGVARYGWELVAADGAVAVGGTDIAEIGDDGRLVRVTGFFGDLPALER